LIDKIFYDVQALKHKLGDMFIPGESDIPEKPFLNFADHCVNHWNSSPYNPKNMNFLYDKNDKLSREEFEQLTDYDKAQYKFYHLWKSGKLTMAQASKIDFFDLF
jgi:hypothetical protein